MHSETMGLLWNGLASLGLALSLCVPVAPLSAAAASGSVAVDVSHIVPAFNPALDAVRPPNVFGTGKVWRVGPTETYKAPSDVVGLVRDGDIVEIAAATYKCDQSVRWTANNLTLIGVGGRAVLDATGCSIRGGKGIWNPTGTNLIVANVEFVGAQVPDLNGAGIRYDGGGYLYITNSYFHDSQNGILYTPNPASQATNNVVIDDSEFARNGGLSGRSHNMYINVCNSFVLRFSYTHDALIGHEVKSRAYTNYILYNRIAGEASGRSSYNIDLPQGGLSYIIGNVIQKSPNADNGANISYSVEDQTNPVQKVFIVNNTIVNDDANSGARNVLFIADKNLAEARMVNNLIVGMQEFQLLTGVGAGKVRLSGNVVTENPAFFDANNRIYNLTSASPAIDRAVDAGSAEGLSLVPTYQFAFLRGGEARPVVGRLDVGAYEYSPEQRITPAPTVTLTAAATPVAFNTPARLSWSTTNADHCSASGDWSGPQPASGSFTTSPLTANASYSLVCAGSSGTASTSLAVAVNDSAQAEALGRYTWKEVPHSDFSRVCPNRVAYADILGTGDCTAKVGYATGVYVPALQKWYLFGGGGSRLYYGNEVYAFDVKAMKAERLTDPTHISETKEYYPSDPYGSKIHLNSCDGTLHLRSGGIVPAPRGVTGEAAYDPLTKTVIFGPWGVVRGSSKCDGVAAGQYATDQWSFDPFTNQWKLLAPADDRYGSTSESTWFLDPATGIAYNGDASRLARGRGAYLINYGTTPPAAVLVNTTWPYTVGAGSVGVDTRNHYAVQLIQTAMGATPSVAVYDLNGLSMDRYGAGTPYKPETSWKVLGDTSLLEATGPAITFNPKLDMFVAWVGTAKLYFLQPDYRTKTLNIISKRIDNGPTVTEARPMAGFFSYLPDHDAYLAFTAMDRNVWLLLPPGSPMP